MPDYCIILSHICYSAVTVSAPQSTDLMGFFRFSVVFLVSVLQQQIDGSDQPPTGLKCPPNSYPAWVTECEFTCGNANVDLFPSDCRNNQKPGCRCDKGLFAQSGTCGESVKCVHPTECKVKCDLNKSYEWNVTKCEATCENPKLPELCLSLPRPRCVCEKGYYRFEKGGNVCIKKEDCNPPQ